MSTVQVTEELCGSACPPTTRPGVAEPSVKHSTSSSALNVNQTPIAMCGRMKTRPHPSPAHGLRRTVRGKRIPDDAELVRSAVMQTLVCYRVHDPDRTAH